MSKINLIHDNCFNYFPQISDKSIDLILCDLPYGTTHNSWDCQLDLQQLWAEYERVIVENQFLIRQIINQRSDLTVLQKVPFL